MARLQDQVALVTGGASGIGLACARRFASEGAALVLVDLDEGALAAAAGAVGTDDVVTIAGDVCQEPTNEAMCALALERFGRLDVAVNAAGRGDFGLVVDLGADQWRSIIELCLTGVFLSTKHEARAMRDAGRGSIINISSLNGVQAAAGMASYAAAKAGVLMLTQVAAKELGPAGVRVNAIAPGLIDTPATSVFFAVPEIRDEFVDNAAIKRWGTPDDVAAAAAFLASDDASWITGETLLVDGGAHTARYPDLPAAFARLARP